MTDVINITSPMARIARIKRAFLKPLAKCAPTLAPEAATRLRNRLRMHELGIKLVRQPTAAEEGPTICPVCAKPMTCDEFVYIGLQGSEPQFFHYVCGLRDEAMREHEVFLEAGPAGEWTHCDGCQEMIGPSENVLRDHLEHTVKHHHCR